MAAEKRACIGAHVSFVDKENFGRTQLDTSPAELREQVLWQASALDGLCRGAGTRYHLLLLAGTTGDVKWRVMEKPVRRGNAITEYG